MVVINADDFGLNERVNQAIIGGFKLGLCSSTTLMATMPGFEEACDLAHDNKLVHHVGIHLVLRDGYPLTSEIREHKLFCDKDGMLSFSRRPYNVTLSWSEKCALAGEIRAQIKRCRMFRVPLTHLDSHHHTHTHWAVLSVLLPVVRSEEIRYVRIARNVGENIGFAKKCYKDFINRKLVLSSLAGSKYFGSVEDYAFIRARAGAAEILRLHQSLEVMVHPTLDLAGGVVNSPRNEPLAEVVRELPICKDAVSFSGLKYV